jgi:hypothetical protein
MFCPECWEREFGGANHGNDNSMNTLPPDKKQGYGERWRLVRAIGGALSSSAFRERR